MKTQYPNLAIFSHFLETENLQIKSLLFRFFLKFKISLGEISPVKKTLRLIPLQNSKAWPILPLHLRTDLFKPCFRVGRDVQSYFTESAQQRSFSSKLVAMLQPRATIWLYGAFQLECDHN
jgi:hypothetical protein